MPSPIIFMDGCDRYGPRGNYIIGGDWTGWFTGINLSLDIPCICGWDSINGRPGGSIYLNIWVNDVYLQTAFPVNYTRICGSIRVQPVYYTGNVNQVSGFTVMNAGTRAWSINLDPNTGVVQLRTGSYNGAIIASGGVVADQSSHVISFDITTGANAPYAVYLDGILLFSGTGNTGNGLTNINVFRVYVNYGTNGNYGLRIDDVVLFDPTQPGYTSDYLIDNLMIETQFPSGDIQTDFTYDGNTIPPYGLSTYAVYWGMGSNNSYSVTGNRIYLLRIVPNVNCTIRSLSINPQNANGSMRLRPVIYSESAGQANTLLSTGPDIIGITSNLVVVAPLTTPIAVTAGTAYWIGFQFDQDIYVHIVDYNITNRGVTVATPFASGPPSGPVTINSTNLMTWHLWANCTGAAVSWASINQNPPLTQPTSQLHSSTAGHEDLFTFPALVTTATRIYACSVKALIAKADAGSRQISLNMKSAGVDGVGSVPSQPLSTTITWQDSIFDVDPATGVAWTQSGVNSAQSGLKIIS